MAADKMARGSKIKFEVELVAHDRSAHLRSVAQRVTNRVCDGMWIDFECCTEGKGGNFLHERVEREQPGRSE